MTSRNSKSILFGVDDVIEKWLGIADNDKLGKQPRYQSIAAAKQLSGNKPSSKETFPAKQILNRIRTNWNDEQRQGSKENWRWAPELLMSPSNKGEKELEKLAAFLLGESEWTNQIPVCSGLMPRSEGGRAIDLVREISETTFEFIELKFKLTKGVVTGDRHPMYAALELLEYGMLYVFAREKKLIKTQKANLDLSQADTVDLVVLGPESWYGEYDFQWLADAINESLNELLNTNWCKPKQALKMRLCFRKLDKDFLEAYAHLKHSMELFRTSFPRYQPVYTE
jgi:hypothetical protein